MATGNEEDKYNIDLGDYGYCPQCHYLFHKDYLTEDGVCQYCQEHPND